MTLALLLALVVSGVGVWVSRRWRVLGQAVMVLGGLGLVGVLALEVRQNLFPPQPKAPGRGEMAVSACLANRLMQDLSTLNGNVILLFPQRQFMDADTEQSYEEAFTLPLRHGHGNLHLKALHLEATKGKTGYDLSAFKQAIAQAQGALAIISYAGAPAGFETLLAEQPKHTLIHVFDADGTTNWFAGLKEGLISAVVLPQPGTARAREKVAGMPGEIFERYYLLATPESADQAASQLSKR